jgi:hypothetical protein
MPLKFATRRAAAATQQPSLSTRSAVDEIRRATGEMLTGFTAARLAQTKATHKGLHKEDVTRAKMVRSMMESFRKQREQMSHETRANLQNYIEDVHASVENSMREADEMLHDIASQRRKFASSLTKSLVRTHQSNARAERKEMQELHNAREQATRKVKSGLHNFADGLHRDVSAFRSELREQLGTPNAQPAMAPKKAAHPGVKAEQPKANKAPVKGKAKAKAQVIRGSSRKTGSAKK